MPTRDLVIVDTCIWVPFFNRVHSSEKKSVDVLLEDDRVAIIGPLLAEVLMGFRRQEHADWVASMLRGVHFLETPWVIWRKAAELARKLIAKNRTLPLSDLVIAAVALENDMAVYTSDPHFDPVPNLKRHAS
jgi:predicted nucleic acid-binding protein